MSILDLQTLETPKPETTEESYTGGGGSRASLLLCGDSSLSVTTCN
ncbi:SapB/AmfS family lanthipeptide [Streptomyces sp. NPDC048650]